MRKPFFISFLCLMMFFSLGVCALADEDEGILKGRIFDAQTQEGLGGILVLVAGEKSTYQGRTNDFGYFIFKLKPGAYTAQLEQLDQKIGFQILPAKVANLSIPLKAAAMPGKEKIEYAVRYTESQNRAGASPAAKENESKTEDPEPPKGVKKEEPRSEEPPEKTELPGEYPLKGVSLPESKPVPPGKQAPAVAVVEFKDTSGKGLGLAAAQTLAHSLFDQGSVKVIGPDSITAAIGGEPADPLNAKFGEWVSKKLGADVVLMGHIRKSELEPHQYLFFMAMKARVTAVIQIMDAKTGNILSTFTETGASGMSGTTSAKDRYFEDRTTARLFAKAIEDLDRKVADRLGKVLFRVKNPLP